MAKPSPTFSSLTAAVVSMLAGVKPSLPSIRESAIEKHDAWAAAMSSSGLLPGSDSKRAATPYGVFFKAPHSVELPALLSLTLPPQTAEPFSIISAPFEARHGTPFVEKPRCGFERQTACR